MSPSASPNVLCVTLEDPKIHGSKVRNAETALSHLELYPTDVVVVDQHSVLLLDALRLTHPHIARIACGVKSLSAHRFVATVDDATLSATIQRCFETQQRIWDPNLRSLISQIDVLPS